MQGTSLVVQWLGLYTFTAEGWVQSLVGELRSHKPCGAAKKKYTQDLHRSLGILIYIYMCF